MPSHSAMPELQRLRARQALCPRESGGPHSCQQCALWRPSTRPPPGCSPSRSASLCGLCRCAAAPCSSASCPASCCPISVRLRLPKHVSNLNVLQPFMQRQCVRWADSYWWTLCTLTCRSQRAYLLHLLFIKREGQVCDLQMHGCPQDAGTST